MDEYITHPEAFKSLELEEQLQVVADIILHFAQLKTDALRKAGKTRTDSCIEALEFYDLERYWSNLQTNIRRLAELEALKVRRGL